MNRRAKVLVGIAVCAGVLMAGAVLLRVFGLLIPFRVPAASMEPTIAIGDHVFMEGVSYLRREPQRGDLLVFKTDGTGATRGSEVYVKRLAGLPGETLRMVDGKLFVNDKPVSIMCSTGEIYYASLPASFTKYLLTSRDKVTVPSDAYFVLGDNSANSWDSRSWGFVPARNVMGQIGFRYWPPGRLGGVK